MGSSGDALRERLTIAIERATCASLVGPDDPALCDAVAAVAAILDDAGDIEELAPLREVLSGDMTELAPIVERLAGVWQSADDVAPPPPPAEDELAMLAGDPELAGMFIGEALDHLGSIESLVLQLESAPDDPGLLNDIFRPFHTIKGNAGALGLTTIQALAHAVENLLDRARSGKHRLRTRGIEIVLQAVDLLAGQIQDVRRRLGGETPHDFTRAQADLIAEVVRLIESGEQEEAGPVAELAAPGLEAPAPDPVTERAVSRKSDEAATSSVKVDTRKLDNLVDMVGELVIVQSILNENPVLASIADERLTRHIAQLKRITSELQRNAMAMRMVPIRPTFQKMARLVRDLSRKSCKQVELVLSGEETELDRKVVEEINDPIMHMVRNSVDHGIEPADLRVSRGKRPAGTLSLSAFHQGGNIVIAIADDGAGLNTERIREKAIALGLIEAGAPLPVEDIHQLIFHPGFSTAEKVTEISGRGVGMDVVRRNLESLRGRVDIRSLPGEGTTFEIRLPLTLAIIDGLLLGVGDQRFVLPTFSVAESLRPAADQVHTVHGEPRMIRVRNSLLPLVRLADLFGVPGARLDPTEATVVVIDEGGRRVALLVDRLLGKQEVVIKSLGESFASIRGVAGGAILGDGRIGLILDAHGLVGLKDGAATAA